MSTPNAVSGTVWAEYHEQLVETLRVRFRSFGGGKTSAFNPIVNALKDAPPQFAAGVDIADVVDAIADDMRRYLSADLEALLPIAVNVRTQDNRCTANPIFAVQQRRRIWGVEDGDGYEWRHTNDWERVDDEKAADLERDYDILYEVPKGYARVAYMDIWEFVTACFTEQGCKDYLAINGHNLDSPRIYVYGGFRNAEWETMRKFLAALSTERAPATATEVENA